MKKILRRSSQGFVFNRTVLTDAIRRPPWSHPIEVGSWMPRGRSPGLQRVLYYSQSIAVEPDRRLGIATLDKQVIGLLPIGPEVLPEKVGRILR